MRLHPAYPVTTASSRADAAGKTAAGRRGRERREKFRNRSAQVGDWTIG